MDNVQSKKLITIRRQTLDEMRVIYQKLLSRHFPADEIKPFRYIEAAYKEGRYIGYGLYNASGTGECLAYAWMCYISEENWALLDYYAVTEALRGQGLGSWFLREILTEHTQEMPVIIEVEDPDRIEEKTGVDAELEMEKEKQKRLRRISFYQKNGVRETKFRASVLQVPYRIMVYLKTDEHERRGCNNRKEPLKTDTGKGIQCDVQGAAFDGQSLKKAYYSFYSHLKNGVMIGETHKNEQL